MALINKLNELGDAVRERTGLTEKMTLDEMAIAIKEIPGPVVEEITITENGTYHPSEAVDGFWKVEVDVPERVPVVEEITITENGTYEPNEGVDGFNKVIVATTGSMEIEPIVLSDNCAYTCAGTLGGTYIDLFGNTITTKDITYMSNMFYNCTAKKIPFDINCKANTENELDSSFCGCANITTVPKVYNIKVGAMGTMLKGCFNLEYIPDDWCDTWDWSAMDNATSKYGYSRAYPFHSCYKLRSFPMEFFNHGNPIGNYSSSIYYGTFLDCYSLDEVIDLPFPHYNAEWTGNAFSSTFSRNNRLKNFTFKMQEDGSPYVMNWKSQTITMGAASQYTGSAGFEDGVIGFSAGTSNGYHYSDLYKKCGYTLDTLVYNDETYAALKDNPDYWTMDVNYSRYNKESAMNLINTLPDTSAYLASKGGTNTVVFKGQSGAKTDGGAINTLTEEEIAIAAAKGWTVSLV